MLDIVEQLRNPENFVARFCQADFTTDEEYLLADTRHVSAE
jgi:hypothetical protein